MRIVSLWAVLVCSLSLACRGASADESQARCENITAQIDQALQDYTESGNLLPTAVPCELTAQSFDPRVARQNVERVLGQFQAACEQQAACCSGVCLPSEPADDDPAELVPPPATPPPYVNPARPSANQP
jgi:hypothetical protein